MFVALHGFVEKIYGDNTGSWSRIGSSSHDNNLIGMFGQYESTLYSPTKLKVNNFPFLTLPTKPFYELRSLKFSSISSCYVDAGVPKESKACASFDVERWKIYPLIFLHAVLFATFENGLFIIFSEISTSKYINPSFLNQRTMSVSALIQTRSL